MKYALILTVIQVIELPEGSSEEQDIAREACQDNPIDFVDQNDVTIQASIHKIE